MITSLLAENVTHSARVLRAAGLPVGPDQVVTALKALKICGIEQRQRRIESCGDHPLNAA